MECVPLTVPQAHSSGAPSTRALSHSLPRRLSPEPSVSPHGGSENTIFNLVSDSRTSSFWFTCHVGAQGRGCHMPSSRWRRTSCPSPSHSPPDLASLRALTTCWGPQAVASPEPGRRSVNTRFWLAPAPHSTGAIPSTDGLGPATCLVLGPSLQPSRQPRAFLSEQQSSANKEKNPEGLR